MLKYSKITVCGTKGQQDVPSRIVPGCTVPWKTYFEPRRGNTRNFTATGSLSETLQVCSLFTVAVFAKERIRHVMQ